MADAPGPEPRDAVSLDAREAPEAGEAGGPAALPAALRQDWPVPWQPVWGDKRGPWRTFLSRSTEALIGLAVRLPDALLAPFFGALSRILVRVMPERTRVAREFLRQALGPLPERELRARVRRSWSHFLRVAIEAERFLRRVPEERVLEHFDVEWCPGGREALESGKGCVVVTAHVGNWEVAPALAPWLGFDPFYAVAKPIRNRPFSKKVQRVRERLGVRLLPRRGAMKDAARVLAAGGSIGMLLDQRARKKPVLAPFFGRLARCDRSAGVLMKRLGAPVLLVACYRTERPLHFRARFFECLSADEFAGKSPEEVAARIIGVFERMILAAPDQYFWLHDRYKDTPPHAADPGGEAERAGGRLSPGTPSVVE
jgi:KDO2-lipid IV(A) lauroyltransferase